MLEQNDHNIRHQLHLAQFAGYPIYFFDIDYLLANLAALAGWDRSRLKLAVAPLFERALGRGDMTIATDRGVYMIFANRAGSIANDKADALCIGILKELSGAAGFAPEHRHRVCRLSSTRDLATDLGISSSVHRPFADPGAVATRPGGFGVPQTEGEKFTQELNAHFVENLLSQERGRFLFSPIWDAKKERVTAFDCRAGAAWGRSSPENHAADLALAALQCRQDAAVLAAATRGVRHVLSQGDIALMTVPVHAETLSWAMTRNAYVELLGQIDTRLLTFIAPRIIGLDRGSNLSQITIWAGGLHRHVRWTFVLLPNMHFDFARAGALGVTGFGLSAPPAARADAAALDMLAGQAVKLCRVSANQSAVAYVDNVVSLPELLLLKSKGVRFLAGAAIGPGSEMPGRVRALSFGQSPVQTEWTVLSA